MASDPNTSIVYPEIRVLDPSITTPDFVLFNGFLQQQGDGDVRFEGLEFTLNVPELPKFTIEDGYYQIWGGTQSVIAPANDFDISGGDNIAFAASLLLGGSVDEYFDVPGHFDDSLWNAMAHTSLLEFLNNPTSMPLEVEAGQTLNGDVYETPFFSYEAVEVDGETSAIINFADSFPSEYEYNDDWRAALFEEQLVVDADEFGSFSNNPLSGYLSPSIEVATTTLSNEDPLVEWEYWGSVCGETTSEGYELPCGGGGFFVFGNIIDELNEYRDSPWDPTNPDDPDVLSLFHPTDFLDWAAGDFNGLNQDLREAHEWILDAAKYLRFQRAGCVDRESGSDTFQISIFDSGYNYTDCMCH